VYVIYIMLYPHACSVYSYIYVYAPIDININTAFIAFIPSNMIPSISLLLWLYIGHGWWSSWYRI